MVDSGQGLERKIKKILDENIGKKITYNGKKYLMLDWGKPLGQKKGEVKTDFLLVLQELNSEEIEMVRISGKQRNMASLHNKLTANWCESIYGNNWKEHLLKQTKSIIQKDGFRKDKLVNFETETITLGYRHEISYEPEVSDTKGRLRGVKTKPGIYPAVFWGEGCPKEYRDGKMKKLLPETKQKLKELGLSYGNNINFIKDSGIPDYVIKADQNEINNIGDILNNLHEIKEFAKDYKDGIIDAFFAHNYRIDWTAVCKHCEKKYRIIWADVFNEGRIISTKLGKCPHCGDSGRKNNSSEPIQGLYRSMAISVKWKVKHGKLDGVLVLDKHHHVLAENVLVDLRNCLLELGIPDDNNFNIQMLEGKVTDRTKNNLVKEDLLKML